ncbi:MAG: hypothetical protein ACUVQY_09700 [Thermoproteota archaeon]
MPSVSIALQASLPGACEIELKLLFLRNGAIIGAQAADQCNEVGEIINQAALIIQNRMSIREIIMIQYGTHLKITASPISNLIVAASIDVFRKKFNL